jgi:hypothetical protein
VVVRRGGKEGGSVLREDIYVSLKEEEVGVAAMGGGPVASNF